MGPETVELMKRVTEAELRHCMVSYLKNDAPHHAELCTPKDIVLGRRKRKVPSQGATKTIGTICENRREYVLFICYSQCFPVCLAFFGLEFTGKYKEAYVDQDTNNDGALEKRQKNGSGVTSCKKRSYASENTSATSWGYSSYHQRQFRDV